MVQAVRCARAAGLGEQQPAMFSFEDLVIWLLFQVGYVIVSFLITTLLMFVLDAPTDYWWIVFLAGWILLTALDVMLKPRA
jgi:hypothetical protein